VISELESATSHIVACSLVYPIIHTILQHSGIGWPMHFIVIDGPYF